MGAGVREVFPWERGRTPAAVQGWGPGLGKRVLGIGNSSGKGQEAGSAVGIPEADAQCSGRHSSLCLSPCVINLLGPCTAQLRSRRDTGLTRIGCQPSARFLRPDTPGAPPGSASRSSLTW